MQGKYLIIAAVAVLLAAGLSAAATTNSTTTNSTATVSNGTVYVVTPSGTIHIVYKTNGTMLVLNYNNKTINVNLKTVVYNGTTAYYIHVVGHAVGQFNASSSVKQIYEALKAGNTTKAMQLLKQLAQYVATNNATKKAELNVMVAAKALNGTSPNATALKAKIEYEIERRAKALNGTSSELEVKAHVRDLAQMATFLRQVAKQIEPIDPQTAAQLTKAAAYVANLTSTLKKAELYLGNGTYIEIKKTGQGYAVEVEVKKGKVHKDSHDEKDEKAKDEKKEDKGVKEEKKEEKSDKSEKNEEKKSGGGDKKKDKEKKDKKGK
ncbi:hypothetical protein [Pyrobaculum ferrireducens]|uniref:Uncharacterized protein n=1 Tax=Pyrobaculum ferrireducens TaxID=1104324 RepID=G7VB56_9CREN|nr:hypothetical protein [Pyrobaculum ferrireducens]AET32366.1 hypothetical protein P186_0925 [Pyrobaculum ferrireducens]